MCLIVDSTCPIFSWVTCSVSLLRIFYVIQSRKQSIHPVSLSPHLFRIESWLTCGRYYANCGLDSWSRCGTLIDSPAAQEMDTKRGEIWRIRFMRVLHSMYRVSVYSHECPSAGHRQMWKHSGFKIKTWTGSSNALQFIQVLWL